jgi:dihydroneopterin aldolase
VWCAGQGQGVLDYSDLYAITEQSVGSGHTRYLEDVADRVVTRALDLPGATGARVTVRKPHVALSGPLECAEVVLERERDV